MNKNQKQDSVRHPYLRRLVAFLVDWYISSFFALLPTIVFQSINGKDLVLVNRIDTLHPAQAVTATMLALVIYTLYFCVVPLKQHGGFQVGQTPGRRLLGITVVKADRSELKFLDLLIRDFVGILLLQGNTTSINIYLMALVEMFTGSAAFVPYLQLVYYLLLAFSLMMLFTKRKQTLHDMLSSTCMVVASLETSINSRIRVA